MTAPKEARGGTFAPNDIKLIKEALLQYAQTKNLDDVEQSKVVNLLHRLGRIS